MTRKLPPGPPLPALVQAGIIWWAPIWYLHACQHRYGDVFRIEVPGLGTLVYLTDPADIKTVLRGDPNVFRAGEAAAPLGAVLGENSVLMLDGDKHRKTRALMMPAFHGDAVRKQIDQMVAITADEVARWPVGEPFALHPRMRALTLEVILRTVIGVRDADRLGALRVTLPPLMEFGSPLQLIPPPRLLRRLGPWRRHGPRKARAHAVVRAEVDRCRRDPDLPTRTDTLAMLMRSVDEAGYPMPADELVDQVLTLLVAGHETTATALAWTFERLVRHPDLLARTVQAADDGDDAWLDAVCKEALRARPVAFEVARRLAGPIELSGYHIPAGTLVALSINLVHHSARHYPDPEEFRPERFVGQRVDTSVWFPFGGGVRRCLGATFAQTEMRTVLREVLRRVELAPTTAPDEPQKVRHVTLVPRDGAMVTVRRRLAVPATAAETSPDTTPDATPDTTPDTTAA